MQAPNRSYLVMFPSETLMNSSCASSMSSFTNHRLPIREHIAPPNSHKRALSVWCVGNFVHSPMSRPKLLTALDIVASVLSILLFLKICTLRISRKHAIPPPGPRQLPIIGNLLDFPSHDHGERFGQLKKQYGNSLTEYLLFFTPRLTLVSSSREYHVSPHTGSNYHRDKLRPHREGSSR